MSGAQRAALEQLEAEHGEPKRILDRTHVEPTRAVWVDFAPDVVADHPFGAYFRIDPNGDVVDATDALIAGTDPGFLE